MPDKEKNYSNHLVQGGFVLGDKDYIKLRDVIFKNAGIDLGDNKKELVHARLSKILRSRSINGFDDYMQLLRNDTSGDEMVALLDAISTNVTHFFREEKHFAFLTEVLEKNTARRSLKIWSAGCSTGEEPYTIAITLAENIMPRNPQLTPYILATDLSTKVLKKAVAGVYQMKSVDKIEPSLLKKYFLKGTKNAEGMIKIKKDISSMVTFQRLNFIEEKSYPGGFDFIFCRNVMIYFNNTTRTEIVSKFYNSLNEGGYLIIGHSESLNGITHKFKYIKPTIYWKPE
jgi:chemotaxis protein methyltransferase CheR